jgi:proline dehydrogenase
MREIVPFAAKRESWVEPVSMSVEYLESVAAHALRHISRDQAIKAYMQESAVIHAVLLRAARRFIGGEILAECLEVARALQEQGCAVTIDYIGENTIDEAVAQQATEEFLRVIQAIAANRLDATVSLDLSHIGLAIDAEHALRNASTLAQAARDVGTEIMINMEGMERIDDILALHQRLCQDYENVGITLQAYLRRTTDDLASALQRPGRIRLVKGAYEEAPGVAEPRGEILDRGYRDYMEILLLSDHPCSLATHDLDLLNSAHKYIRRQKLKKHPFEFEMLYGVTPDRLQLVRERGYRARVYLPYGREWYLYLCHRLAEYPPNIYRAIGDAADMG